MGPEIIEERFDINDFDTKDNRKVLSLTTHLATDIRTYPKLQAERLFELGCLLNNSETTLTIRELGDLTGISFATLSTAKTVAMKLDNNRRKFDIEIDRLPHKSWQCLASMLLPRKKVNKKKILGDLGKKLSYLLNTLRVEPDKDAYNKLSAYRDMLMRYIPLSQELLDQNYIKYYECCCCGDYPPPQNGWDVNVYNKIVYYKYPICSSCITEKRQPDFERIARMYAAYALNLEQAYDKIL